MSYDDYGANPYYGSGGGGGGGGGFMSGSQGGFAGGSQGSPGSGGRKRAADTLRPVTLKQLINADQVHPDAEFTIDGVEVGLVTFVATVRNVSRQATNVSYSMEDGTGAMDVRQWLETADDDSGRTDGIDQNVYVRVVGSLKQFNNKRNVGATVVKPITDFNEIWYHRAEALYVTNFWRKGALPSQGGPSAGGASTSNGVKAEPRSAYAAPSTGAGAGAAGRYADLPPQQRKIMTAVVAAQERTPDGVHVEAIARDPNCQGYSGEALMEGIEFLIGEGHLYTTIDDMHVLAT